MAPPLAWFLGAAICVGAFRPVAGILGKIFRGPATDEQSKEEIPAPEPKADHLDAEPEPDLDRVDHKLDEEEELALVPMDEPLTLSSWLKEAAASHSESGSLLESDGILTDEFSFWPDKVPDFSFWPPPPETKPTTVDVAAADDIDDESFSFWPQMAVAEQLSSPAPKADHFCVSDWADPSSVLEVPVRKRSKGSSSKKSF